MIKSFKLAITELKRDWYSGELYLIGLAILIATACLTSVSFFTDRIRQATEQQATELIAADLVLLSSAPIAKHYISAAIDAKLNYSLNESFRSVVVKDERLELAEVKAVDAQYPIRGVLKTTEQLFAAEKVDNTIPSPGTVWLDNRLLQLLSINVGDSITLGKKTFTAAKILTYEPDRGGDLFNIAPRLLMNRADLDATGLISPASRVQYRLLLGGALEAIKQYREQVQTDSNIQIQGIKDARPEIKTALERADQFLNLAALVSIALAGLAIAMSAQRYAKRHYDSCAIMRCLGLQQQQITQIYLFQLIILALVFSIFGCFLGYIAQEILNQLMLNTTQHNLPLPSLRPIFAGLLAGLITVLAFALPQILHLSKVSPLRVLRRDLTPLAMHDYLVYLIAAVALMLLSPWQSGDIKLTAYTLLGLAATTLILAGCAKSLIHIIKTIIPKLSTQLTRGIANIARRSNQSTIQVIGIGIGITVMLLLTLVRTDLLKTWQNRLPESAPNYFLINIQRDQVDGIKTSLANALNQPIELYPMIRGRLTTINTELVDLEAYPPRARRLAEREFNLSYASTMQADNRLTSGSWWSTNNSDEHYFSVEEGIAETLGIKLGDSLSYLIAGQEITGKVKNLRWVEWDSFHVNFFVVANPKALQDYPSTFIGSVYIPETQRTLLVELVKQFPSMTILDVDALLKQVKSIMAQVVQAIQFIFIFSLLIGLIILFSALQATHDERIQEAALMRALGANQQQILTGLITEFASLGFVTGLLAAFAASGIQLLLAKFVLKIGIAVNPLLWLVAPVICCLITITIGVIGTRRVLSTPPMIVLRG